MEKLREEIKKTKTELAKEIGKVLLASDMSNVPEGKTLDGFMEFARQKAFAKKQTYKSGIMVYSPSLKEFCSWAGEYFEQDEPITISLKKLLNVQTPAPEPQAETKIENLLNYELEDLW